MIYEAKNSLKSRKKKIKNKKVKYRNIIKQWSVILAILFDKEKF